MPETRLLGGKCSTDPRQLAERRARGFSSVELHLEVRDLEGTGRESALSAVRDSGLAVHAVHCPYRHEDGQRLSVGMASPRDADRATSRFVQAATLAGELGVGIAVLHVGDAGATCSETLHRGLFQRHMATLVPRAVAEAPGVTLGLENVPPMAVLGTGPDDHARFPLQYGDMQFLAWDGYDAPNVGCVLDVTHAFYAVAEARRLDLDTAFRTVAGRARPTCVLVHLANPIGAYLERVATVPNHALAFTPRDRPLLAEVLAALRGFACPFTVEVNLEDQADSGPMWDTLQEARLVSEESGWLPRT